MDTAAEGRGIGIVDGPALVRGLCLGAAARAGAAGVKLVWTSNVASLPVAADAEALCRALWAMLERTLRVAPRGGRIEARFTAMGDFAEIAVSAGCRACALRLPVGGTG